MLQITGRFALSHLVDGTGQLLGAPRQGLAWPRVFLHAAQLLLPLGMMAEAYHGRFRAGPRARRIAALRPRGARAFPRRCFGALAEAAGGHDILPPREALEVMDVREPHEAQHGADPRARAQPSARVGSVLLGRGADRQLHVAEPGVVGGNQCESDCETLWHGRIGTPRGTARAVGLISDRLADLGEGVLPRRIVDVGEAFRPFPPQLSAPPEQGPRGPHRRRLAVRWGQQAAAEEPGHVLGLARIVCGLPAMESLHGERVPEDKRHACTGTQSGQPVPRKEAVDADDQIGPGGRHGCEKRCRASRHGPVQQELPLLVQDAEVQGAGMQVDAAVNLVLLRLEAPEVSSSLLRESLPLSAYHRGMLGRGPQ